MMVNMLSLIIHLRTFLSLMFIWFLNRFLFILWKDFLYIIVSKALLIWVALFAFDCFFFFCIIFSFTENKIDEGANCEGSKEKLEKERRRQNKVIRKKFSINYFDPGPNLNNSKYKDRAGKRRETVGSDNPYEKTQVASIDTYVLSLFCKFIYYLIFRWLIDLMSSTITNLFIKQ